MKIDFGMVSLGINFGDRHQGRGRRQWFLLAVFLLALGLLLSLRAVSPAQAATTTITLESAATVINGCDTLDLFIRINDVTNLYGADVRLTFDPTVLEVTVIQELNDLLQPPFYIAAKQYDNTAGTAWLALTQLNPTPEASGSGNFARITFRAKAEQIDSPITISYSKLADRQGMTIPATAVGGSLTTQAPQSPEATIAQLNTNTVRISWNAIPGVTNYNIYRDTYAYFTPAIPYQVVTALTFDDVGVLGNSATNYFYAVRSTCANGFESPSSNHMGEFDYDLASAASLDTFNVIALPLDSADSIVPFQASGLATYIGSGVKQVLRWSPASQNFNVYRPLTSPPPANFALTTAQAYVIQVDGTTNPVLTFVNDVPNEGSVTFSFSIGSGSGCALNAISIPLDRTDLVSASMLATDIGGVDQVLFWNPATQNYRVYRPGVSPPFANFAIRTGYPYFVCLNETAPLSWP
ncbi:MAG: hypothetical protein H6659_05615 [Ardenticatenaceae bacterium]|nr:hypothetical protein [Ardenticatenaceae bacterium]